MTGLAASATVIAASEAPETVDSVRIAMLKLTPPSRHSLPALNLTMFCAEVRRPGLPLAKALGEWQKFPNMAYVYYA